MERLGKKLSRYKSNIYTVVKHSVKWTTFFVRDHPHSYHIPTKANPLCAGRIHTILRKNGLFHSNFVKRIDGYMDKHLFEYQKKLEEEAETDAMLIEQKSLLRDVVNEERRKAYQLLVDYIIAHKDNKLTSRLLNRQVDANKQTAKNAITAAMEDPDTPAQLYGSQAPNRNKIIKHIAMIEEKYQYQILEGKQNLEKLIFHQPQKVSEDRLEHIRRTELEAEQLKINIIAVCNELKRLALDYQQKISDKAIQKENEQFNLQFYQTAFLGVTRTLQSIPIAGQIFDITTASLTGIFEVLLAYVAKNTPVDALQKAAKFLVEVVQEEANRLIQSVQENHHSLQKTLELWQRQLKYVSDEEIPNPIDPTLRDFLSTKQLRELHQRRITVLLELSHTTLLTHIQAKTGISTTRIPDFVKQKINDNESELQAYIAKRKKAISYTQNDFNRQLVALMDREDVADDIANELTGLLAEALNLNLTILYPNAITAFAGSGQNIVLVYDNRDRLWSTEPMP